MLLESLMASPHLRKAVRGASDWVDLQWSVIIDVLKEVAPQARGRLLDVGCGTKPYEQIFRPYVTEYLGIENEGTFTATAASLDVRGPDLTYAGDRLPFEDRSFDTVLNVQVLEHTPRPAALVNEMARVLKDDGTLILSAPFQFRLHEQPHDYFRYTPHGLGVLFTDAGLEITNVLTHGGLWRVVGHKLNSYLAMRVARVSGLAQAMGKLSHETATNEKPRTWTLPFVGSAMVGIAGAARIMDRLMPEPEETLGFVVLARRAPARRA